MIKLPKGLFYISDTIELPSNTELSGCGELTKLILSSSVNKNMFTNQDKVKGNENIKISNISLDGNWKEQFKPENEKRVSFCNMVYFAKCKNVSFLSIKAENVFQTILHFNNCDGVNIYGLDARYLGWSGISTSGTDNIIATKVYIFDSGNDHRHSAIHLDGGIGSYLEVDVNTCVGNGVMLDSTFSDFSRSAVKANCKNCMRGVSCIGSPGKIPMNILIQVGVMENNEIGVMVSNASDVFISNVSFIKNTEVALLFQGRVGGNNSLASGCTFEGNFENIKQIHNSNNNFFFNNFEV